MKHCWTIGIVLLSAVSSEAAPFFDDFESGSLSQWTGKQGNPANAHGVIVVDPLNPQNHALAFSARNSAGDIFTIQSTTVIPSAQYVISFDYLGYTNRGVTNLGGFAGYCRDFPGPDAWYYGTWADGGATATLIDDNQWHHYSYTMPNPPSFGPTFRLMFEQYSVSNGVPGEVFFDNIRLTVNTPVSGRIGFTYFDTFATPPSTALFEFRLPGTTSTVYSVIGSLDATGNYNISGPPQPGPYVVSVKHTHWLRKNVAVNTANGNSSGVNFPLVNGDCDLDNEVGIGDFSLISSAYNTGVGDPNWNPLAELNGDNEVDIVDFAILSQSYGAFGDE